MIDLTHWIKKKRVLTDKEVMEIVRRDQRIFGCHPWLKVVAAIFYVTLLYFVIVLAFCM